MFHGFHSTVIGDSHVKKGIVCQDSSGTYVCDRYAVAVVADGHGSAKHFRSEVGSQIAVQITLGLRNKYMRRDNFPEQFKKHPNFILKQMEKQILMKWREAIQAYQSANPFTEEELLKVPEDKRDHINIPTVYGSTVLVAVMTDEFSFGLVLGDGGFVVLEEDGDAYIPIEDKNSRANYTSSLCNTNAYKYFEHWYTRERPKAMFVSTDGLFKSFASESDFLKYHGLLAQMFGNQDRMSRSVKKNFERRTRDGSGDDISIAMVYHTDQTAITGGDCDEERS